MTQDFTTRLLARRDLAGLLALYRHLHDEPPLSPSDPGAIATWNALARDPAHLYMGSFIAQRLASACNAAVIPNLTRGGRPYAVIENVVTAPDHRRAGIGTATMQALIEVCVQRGCYKIMLMSAAGRPEAHAFYAALGFDADAKQAFVYKPSPNVS